MSLGRKAAVATLSVLLPLVAAAQQDRFCAQVGGATVVAQDAQGTVLGHVTDRFDPESIFNEYGRFGSRYATESIWNSRGTYGSAYSGFSPFNDHSGTPPVLMKGGQPIGLLTTNARLPSAVSPDVLRTLCQQAMLPRSKAAPHALAMPLETPGPATAAERPPAGDRAAGGGSSSDGVPACVRLCAAVPAAQFTGCLERCEAAGADPQVRGDAESTTRPTAAGASPAGARPTGAPPARVPR